MCAGEAPDLYSDIEMDSLVKGLKDKLESDNFEGDLSQYFANSEIYYPNFGPTF